MSASHEEFDQTLRQAFEAGAVDQTATLFLERYGGEILGFLCNRLRNSTAGADVFSEFAEDFWKGLPNFRWQSSLRSWAYALARNAASRYQKAPAQRLAVHQSFGGDSPYGQQVALHRSKTNLYMQSEVKSRMRELRERLGEEEQNLLILRVDQKLSWKELAVALSDEGSGDLAEAELSRRATNLRQQFQKLKSRLRAMAVEEGLLEPESPSKSR
jgi:RNA polymerase sigma-70 factor (ECF subfamily)